MESLAPKQLVNLWMEERNEAYLAKILANKESNYPAFVKRLEIDKYYSIIKRDIGNGLYTIEDRRARFDNVHFNEHEKFVIDNFEKLEPEMSLEHRLKAPVLDAILKIKKLEVTSLLYLRDTRFCKIFYNTIWQTQ